MAFWVISTTVKFSITALTKNQLTTTSRTNTISNSLVLSFYVCLHSFFVLLFCLFLINSCQFYF